MTFNGFKAALKACSAALTDEEIRQAFVACDVNSDGVVDYMEFAKAVGTYVRPAKRPRLCWIRWCAVTVEPARQ